jgi:D-serine deaminase-like pyridoxal phosphate-dependent protein
VTTERAGSLTVHPGAVIDDVDTPTLIVDLDRMASNIEAMARLSRDGDLALRPHVKSHKIPELAMLQMEAGAVGITCQKLGEAEVMVAAGLPDITIAYPISHPPVVNAFSELIGYRVDRVDVVWPIAARGRMQ